MDSCKSTKKTKVNIATHVPNFGMRCEICGALEESGFICYSYVLWKGKFVMEVGLMLLYEVGMFHQILFGHGD